MTSRQSKQKSAENHADVALCFSSPRFTPQKTKENRGSLVNIGSELLKIS